jgi:hypothetical protein
MWQQKQRRRRFGPVVLITLGILLVTANVAYWQFTRAIEKPVAVTLPERIAGLSRVEARYGSEAVEVVTQLHDKNFPLSSGAYGMYGDHNGMAMLWVTGTPAQPMASRMVAEMEQAIAENESPFTPVGTREVNGRTIYELTGMGQRHFYFRSASLVIWLAADDPIA